MKLSARTAFLKQSNIRAMTKRINAVNGINLGQGICDQPTPDAIKQGAIKAIEENKSIYSHYSGIDELKDKLLQKFKSVNHLPVTSTDEITVTNGSSGAFVAALHALLQPGDEIILFEPFYGYHVNLLKLFNISIRYTRLKDHSWDIDRTHLESLITDKTKAILITTPSNPCGKVFSESELRFMVDLAHKFDLILITDEVYEHMVYDGSKHISPASLPGAWERTLTMTSFSKTYNMTGWRLGAAIGTEDVIEKMGLITDLLYICAPVPLQHGLVEAFNMDKRYYETMLNEYVMKRELLCTTLEQVGFSVPWPEGAYYIFADFESLSKRRDGFSDDMEAVNTLIDEVGVTAVPGRSFFENPDDGRYKLRFCFAKEIPVLKEACRLITKKLRSSNSHHE